MKKTQRASLNANIEITAILLCLASLQIELYENALYDKGLPDIPLHTSPLPNGHDDYQGMDIQGRKRLLQAFFTIRQHMPIMYHAFSYEKSEFKSDAALITRMKRNMVNLIFDNLEYLQRFDKVKVYYDDGQYIVTKSLHDAIEYAPTQPIIFRQARDLFCAGVAHQLAVDVLAGAVPGEAAFFLNALRFLVPVEVSAPDSACFAPVAKTHSTSIASYRWVLCTPSHKPPAIPFAIP